MHAPLAGWSGPALLCFALAPAALPQPGLSPPANGPRRADPTRHVLVGGLIHTSPTTAIPDAVLILDGDAILRVGPRTDPALAPAAWPAGAVVWDVAGMHLYPGFIDPNVEVEVARPGPAGGTDAPDRHWNINVAPERSALAGAGLDKPTADSLRKLGFTTAALTPFDAGKRRGGIIRGTSAVVSLALPTTTSDPTPRPPRVYLPEWAVAAAIEAGGFGGGGREDSPEAAWFGGYPTSHMGAVALFRQSLEDARGWINTRGASRTGAPLPAWARTLNAPHPFTFDVDSEADALRAVKLAREFALPAVIIGTGTEYRRVAAVAEAAKTLGPIGDADRWIIPLADPRAPDVSSVGRAEETDLRTLLAFEQAPTNPRRLEEAGVHASLTTSKLRSRDEFFTHLRKAVDQGLTKEAALAMITTRPAALLGLGDRLGTLAPGKVANLVVADGDLFATKADAKPDEADKAGEKPAEGGDKPAERPSGAARILSVWIEGQRLEFGTPTVDVSGMWTLEIPGAPAAQRYLQFDGEIGGGKTPKLTVIRDGKRSTAQVKTDGANPDAISFVFDHEPLDGQKGMFTSTAAFIREAGRPVGLVGKGLRPNSASFDFRAARLGPTQALGLWRVTETDGAPAPEGAEFTLDVSARGVRLALKKEGADPIEITADDAVAAGGTLTFRHSLKKLGGEGESTDAVTIEGDVMTGQSTLTDGSKHAYKAVRVKQEGTPRAPKFSEALPGRWAITEFDGAPNPDHGVVYIKTDGSLVFNGRGRVAAAKESKASGAGVTYTLDMKDFGGAGEFKGSATLEGEVLRGSFSSPDGSEHTWKATRRPGNPEAMADVPEMIPVPFQAYGRLGAADDRDVVIRHATVWTMGPRGVIEDGAVVIAGGKVAFVGTHGQLDEWLRTMGPRARREVDAKGGHVTPGIIDCHSHTGLRTANEVGRAVTSMVRVEDEVNADDVNWYRQLAGGVTAVNSLHGSANSIGGQNSVTKLRWGVEDPLGMKMTEAMDGIKFALGENPKRANSGNTSTFRYPQTRMGVEAQIRDRFQAAREYALARKADASTPKDLELEALAEVLAGTRLIHCHSYRQDEILMLGNIARDFGFKIGTYQHILEGYKVAEVLKEYSGGASGFSDWWAYKVEVQDAIPYAFPLMHRLGIVCSFNSDDTEMARRLNTEAAKAVKYGGLKEEEALAFVTLNPAKQLRIDRYVGTLEAGKQADLAVWSGPPLSSLSRCVRTFVDGVERFSIEADQELRKRNNADRERVVQKLLKDKSPASGGGGGGRGGPGGPGGRGGRGRPPQGEMSGSELERGDCGMVEVDAMQSTEAAR